MLHTSKHAMSEQSCENSTAHLQKKIFVQSFGIFSFLFFFLSSSSCFFFIIMSQTRSSDN